MTDARQHLGTAGSGVRGVNRRKVFLALAIKADTQVGVASRTLLSQATVSSSVRELAMAGLVRDTRAERPSRNGISLTPSDHVGVGVHLGYERVVVVARTIDKNFDDSVVRVSAEGVQSGWQAISPMVEQMITEAIHATGRHREDVISLGIAVPRMIDPRTGAFASPVVYPWREDDDPAGDLGALLGVTAVIDNDANLGALAEQTYGTHTHAETVVYVKVSGDVGAGIITHNTILRGRRGMAGEIGHLTVDPDGTVCHCGGRGCLETVISADALIAQVRAARPRSGAVHPARLTEIVRDANAGDVVCERVVRDAGRVLGRCLAHLCNLLNPDLVVMGGELSACGELLKGCTESLRRHALQGAVAEDSGFSLQLGELGATAEAQGALVLGLRGQETREDLSAATTSS
ncbi:MULTISPECIES: ROK family transcriptional regulator [Streptomyces]|uniref:ROK family transcriptional regulator n=1 Tax=Streptomyces TaxID=1883 RepID=UPI00068F8238|nr:ROK family transcriptional regulator [Streptomyces sp. NRRL S-475]